MAIQTDFFHIVATGLQVTTSGVTAVNAIPVMANGQSPKYVRLQALANCYVRPGSSAITATNADILLTPNEDVTLNVSGCTHIAGLQETAAARFNISPLEA